jgi:hypothetical protein
MGESTEEFLERIKESLEDNDWNFIKTSVEKYEIIKNQRCKRANTFYKKNKNKYRCDTCDRSFVSNQSLGKHNNSKKHNSMLEKQNKVHKQGS